MSDPNLPNLRSASLDALKAKAFEGLAAAIAGDEDQVLDVLVWLADRTTRDVWSVTWAWVEATQELIGTDPTDRAVSFVLTDPDTGDAVNPEDSRANPAIVLAGRIIAMAGEQQVETALGVWLNATPEDQVRAALFVLHLAGRFGRQRIEAHNG